MRQTRIHLMWFYTLLALLHGPAALVAADSPQAGLGLDKVQGRGGVEVLMPLRVVAAPQVPVTAFALWLTNAPALDAPTVTMGPDQSNLTVFIDSLGNGVWRVTGLILSGAPLSAGHVATLHWNLPESLPSGQYATAPWSSALFPIEMRGGTFNEWVPTSFLPGEISVGSDLVVTGRIELRPDGGEEILWDSLPPGRYEVRTTTHLSEPIGQWQVLAELVATGSEPVRVQQTRRPEDAQRFYALRPLF